MLAECRITTGLAGIQNEILYLTEIEYEAPESLVSGSILICFTSLPRVTVYSVVFGWNFGVSFPRDMESFSKSALSMLPCHEMREDGGWLGNQVTQLTLRDTVTDLEK